VKAAIVGIAGLRLTAAEIALFGRHPPAGVILFARNVQNPTQLAPLVAELRAALPSQAVLMVDQEGGRVARLRPPHWRDHPPAAALGALFAANPAAGRRAAFLTGALIGADCAAAGFDVVCAPVLDLRRPGAHDVIGDRAFSDDPAAVIALASSVAGGLLATGIQPVGKHAPGHGRSVADSHLELPHVGATDAELATDLEPFQALAHLPWMMTAHICYDAWDGNHPATLSHTVINDVIRGRIGFDGVLVSDDLAMRALSGPPGALARAALAAGCDLALHCAGDLADSAAVLTAVPELTTRGADRLAAARMLAMSGGKAADPAMSAQWDAERAALLT
jgi:beta-N-acetylhexosaminidase